MQQANQDINNDISNGQKPECSQNSQNDQQISNSSQNSLLKNDNTIINKQLDRDQQQQLRKDTHSEDFKQCKTKSSFGIEDLLLQESSDDFTKIQSDELVNKFYDNPPFVMIKRFQSTNQECLYEEELIGQKPYDVREANLNIINEEFENEDVQNISHQYQQVQNQQQESQYPQHTNEINNDQGINQEQYNNFHTCQEQRENIYLSGFGYFSQKISINESKNIPKAFGNHLYNHLQTRIHQSIKELKGVVDFIKKRTQKKQYSYTIKDFQNFFKDPILAEIAIDFFENYLFIDLLTSGKNQDVFKYIQFIDKFILGAQDPEKFNHLK